jgi:tRNA A37 threonylcarbamoyladenosine dehydratase
MNTNNWKSRTELLIGEDQLNILQNAHVLIAGIGGVGGYVAEQLCRAGVGTLTIVDSDIINPSNRNRQIIALHSTEGKKKVEILAERLIDINPGIRVYIKDIFLNENNIPGLLHDRYDFIADCIDTLTPKVALLSEGIRKDFKVISSMGSGGKMDPTQVEVCDIEESHHCKFATLIRKYLHRKNIRGAIQVVFSPEKVSKEALIITDGTGNKRSVVGTISYMPAVFGCFMAAEIVNGLLSASVENHG